MRPVPRERPLRASLRCRRCRSALDPYFLLHYTYGNDYTLDGVFTPGKFGAWRFDKRDYSQQPPPRGLSSPPKGATLAHPPPPPFPGAAQTAQTHRRREVAKIQAQQRSHTAGSSTTESHCFSQPAI